MPCNCVKSKLAFHFPFFFCLILRWSPRALQMLQQVKALKLIFCVVEYYAQYLALFSPTNKVLGDITAAAAVRRVLLSVSICVALSECSAHQCPGVCVPSLSSISNVPPSPIPLISQEHLWMSLSAHAITWALGVNSSVPPIQWCSF